MGQETGNWAKGKKGFQPGDYSSGKVSPGALAEEIRGAQGDIQSANSTRNTDLKEVNSVYDMFSTLAKVETGNHAFDWHREPSDGSLVLNNPHPELDGYITVELTDDGRYEAVVHEFEDPEANYEAEIDSRVFDTEAEAKDWAQDWNYATLEDQPDLKPFLPPISDEKEAQGNGMFREANALTTMSGIVCNSCGKETPSREWDGEHLPNEDGAMQDYCSQCVSDHYDEGSSFFPSL